MVCYSMACNAMLCCAVLLLFVLCCAVLTCLCSNLIPYAVLYCSVPCRAVPCRAVLCRAVPCRKPAWCRPTLIFTLTSANHGADWQTRQKLTQARARDTSSAQRMDAHKRLPVPKERFASCKVPTQQANCASRGWMQVTIHSFEHVCFRRISLSSLYSCCIGELIALCSQCLLYAASCHASQFRLVRLTCR